MASTPSWQEKLDALRPDLPEGEPAPAPAPEPSAPRRGDRLTLHYERKGRGGKEATIVAGFTCPESELLALASRLKKRLGCGGSARGGELLVQGDRRKELVPLLREMGYSVANP